MENFEGSSVVLNVLGIKPNYSELGRIYGMDRRTAKKKHTGVKNEKRGRKEGCQLSEYFIKFIKISITIIYHFIYFI